ncbi:MAG: hypothetical protein K6F15_03695 [Treponema sp.]|nr:hypothetical protein [Treponema sp.]
MKNTKNLNLILALGFVLIFTGFIFTLCLIGRTPDFSSLIVPDILFIAGLLNFYLYLAFKKNAFRFFISINLTLYGIFSSLLVYQVINVSFSEIWPIYIFITSLSLFIAGRKTGKFFSINYDFPAISLFIIAVVFLFFSLDIIKISFTRLALMMCPLLLILGGIFLVLLFFHRKSLLEILPEKFSEELNNDSDIEDGE